MKIVHVATAFPRHEEDVITPWLGELLVAQREAGHDVGVLTSSYRGGGATIWRGIPVRRFRYAPRPFETLTHDETVPDRIRSSPGHAALLPAYMAGGTLGAIAVGRERPDVVHVHWPFPHAWFGGVARAIGGGTALVASFYSVELKWVTRRMPVFRPFLRWSIESADAVTAISTGTARQVRDVFERDVAVIPFAAALDRVSPPQRDAREGGPTILFVGRLVERKGVDVLVRSFAQLDRRAGARLVIVGEGPERAVIEATARQAGVEGRVTLTGRLSATELADAYRSADVFVLPAVVDSRGDTEGLGVVLLEALRFGVPVVASDAGGIPDIVKDGQTGWLTPPGDAAALAAAIREVVASPEEAARRTAVGQALAERSFSLPGIVRDLESCYRGAVARRSGTVR